MLVMANKIHLSRGEVLLSSPQDAKNVERLASTYICAQEFRQV